MTAARPPRPGPPLRTAARRVRHPSPRAPRRRRADGPAPARRVAGIASSVLMLPVATQVEVPSLGPQVLADLPNDGNPTLAADHGGQPARSRDREHRRARRRPPERGARDRGAHPRRPAPLGGVRRQRGRRDPGRPAPGPDRQCGATPRRAPAGQRARPSGHRPGRDRRLDATPARPLGGTTDARGAAGARRTGRRRTCRRTGGPTRCRSQSVATGGGERFEARSGDVRRYVAVAFAARSARRRSRRPRVEILNGTGAVGLAQAHRRRRSSPPVARSR